VRIPLKSMALEFTIFSRKILTAYGPGGNMKNVKNTAPVSICVRLPKRG
jgi:hypothetical protein